MRSGLRLAFCLFSYHPYGGLQRDFLRIATACRSRGHDIHVFAMEWSGERPRGIHIELLPAPRWWRNHLRNRSFITSLRKRLASSAFDLVVGFNRMPGLDVYYAADPCYVASVRERRGSLYRLGARYRNHAACEKAVFSPAAGTRILAIAEQEIKRFRSHYGTPQSRFTLLPPGIAPDRRMAGDANGIRSDLRAEFGIEERERLLLFVGSDFHRKGLDRVIRALASLDSGIRRKTRLVVVGRDNPGPFLRLAKRRGVDRQLSCAGAREDVPRFLLGADILVHPAYSENTGTVLLEALASGLPVLTTGNCGYAFHVERAGAGRVLTGPFSQDSFNLRLAEMLDSDQLPAWRRNAIEYSRSEDLYSLVDYSCELIEKFAGYRC